MSKSLSPGPKELISPATPDLRESNGTTEMDDPDKTVAAVARFIEQLHAKVSSPAEKELVTARLLGMAKARKAARSIIGSHAQAMPLFVSILRSGTHLAKLNVAATLSALCKDEDLRLKVLLGGCIPPLLLLLKSESTEARKAAAEAIYVVSSGGLSDDHVGAKIFVTEGVVPTLWEQLNPKRKQDKVVEGFVTGALRNLCGNKDGFWKAALEAGGVSTIVGLLSSDNVAVQSNAAFLLARLMLAFTDSITKVIESGAVAALLQHLGPGNDISVRGSAADALEALSRTSIKAQKAIVEANGVPLLIESIVAPSKECMQGEGGQALQEHATRALANICGGMSALTLYLGELSLTPRLAAPVADIIGALAYTLMVFEQDSDVEEESSNATKIEDILVTLLKPRDNKLVQERVLEAMASLYGNTFLSKWLNQAEAKKVLIGLITMAATDVQEYLILSVIRLCCDELCIWEAIGKREGIQLLISLLGLSGEQHQEYAVEFLAILTDQVDDSKWAITAAGGIPPLVQLLEMGSQKAGEAAADVLWNLCCHSEDIRACVESAGAIRALLWLLKYGGTKGQEASAKVLTKLIQTTDSDVINQLLSLLLGDSPSSKAHIIKVLGHVLSIAPHSDLVRKEASANKGLRSLVQVLSSSSEETQEYAASSIADIFSTRHDICESLATAEVVLPCMKLLTSNTQAVATQSARALSALSRPTKSSNKLSYISEADVKPLIKLAKTTAIESAETALAALANFLFDPQIAGEALAEDIVSVLTRILGEGTSEGKNNASRALHQLLRHFPVSDVLRSDAQCRFAVLSVVNSLNAVDMDGTDATDALEVLALLVRTKPSTNVTYPPWSSLAEVPTSLEPLVSCLAEGPPPVQDKAIEILSWLFGDQSVILGNLLVAKSGSIGGLANRIMNSTSLEVRVGGTALLICATKEHKIQSIDELDVSGYLKPLIFTLVDMMKRNSSCSSLEIEVRTASKFMERTSFQEGDELDVPDPATVLGGTVALWLLSIVSSFHVKNRLTVVEAGALEALSDRLVHYTSHPQAEFEDTEGIWITALLLAILFEDASVVSSPATMRIIPSLALLLRSEEVIDRYFAAQAMASLVCNGSKGMNLAIANSGAVVGLVTLIGYVESDMPNLVALADEFSLVRNPEQVVLDHLFKIEDIRAGSTARKTIPLLVDLLKPMPDRPSAPLTAVRLLTRLADGSANKLIMAEAGALDALTRYLSLSPSDLSEAAISELLRILFSNREILRYEASFSSLNQLVAVLRLGSRGSRLSAARALHELFDAENIRDTEIAKQAIQPLVDMLEAASESEQHVALSGLIKLTYGDPLNASLLTELERNPLESVYKILSPASSLELKTNAAELCFVLFGNSRLRASSLASECIEPLVLLIQSEISTAVESAVCALERLLDDEQLVEVAAAYDVVDLLVGLIFGSNNRLIEASISILIKLGKDRTPRKLDMVKAGIIDKCIELLPTAPSALCCSIAELFRILTNSSAISKSPDAAKIVEPLFSVLHRPDISLWGQHSALQALVNILEKPQSLATLKLTPSQVIEPLILFLESPSQAIQQLGTELLSHLLAQEHFKEDITTKNAIVPLVQLAGIGILNLQQTAIKALESISLTWPKAVSDADGIFELSKVITQDDPQPPHALWESAALVLSNVLQSNSDYYFKVSPVVLVKLLHSTQKSTITVALGALIVQEMSDVSGAQLITEAGAIDALVDLLRSHQCEEASAKLLEALFNNVRVREMKACKYAIAPLAQYLLDPQTRSPSGKLLAALALGDLSQHEAHARCSDSVSACRALISLLEDQPTEEMQMVATCALQNFVIHSRTNRRAVAEAGGILVVQELLLSNNLEISKQAALLIKLLFSNHTLQEYVSNELIRSLTAALNNEFGNTGTMGDEFLRTLHVIFSNFTKLHVSEAATLCIHHLITALKSGNEAAQGSVLDTLCLLKDSWSTIPADVSKSQAIQASEAIPVLQALIKTCPPSLHEKADSLLHSLPGCLTVTIRRGTNLKQLLGGTNAFCRLTIGNGPPRQTKVASNNTSPEWNEGFTWAFDVPPKGQKLHIVCKSKSTFGKTSLGRVTIQIDKVVSEGKYSGPFSLTHDSGKDGSSRMLEIEINWSNRLSEGPVLKI